MNPEYPLNNAGSIFAFISHYQKSRIVLTAYELELFTVLDGLPKSSEEVAKSIKTDARATDRLMNALSVLGFLQKESGKFSNTKESSLYLVKGKPEYMSGLKHTADLWHTWTTMTDAVRAGTAVYRRPENINDRDENWLESFIGAMHYRALSEAPGTVSKIDLEGVKKVLDLGGGSGIFAMEFVKAGKDIQASVFDLPNVIPITQKYIQRENMQDRVNTYGGDYISDDLPLGFDLIFLSAIIHSNSYETNKQLVSKCAKSLNPGGRIIIADWIMDDSRTNPPRGALFALNMLVGTREGDTFTQTEILEWYENAGLRFDKRLESFSQTAMVIGIKP